MDYSCRAKGSEINLWLHTGLIASCCKGTPVHITDTDIPTLLNHPTIRQQKAALDAGIPDASCNYCWQAEKSGKTSNRLYKNAKPLRKTVELTFDNTCNFTCLYCGPKFSSRWQSITPVISQNVLKDTDVAGLMLALEADDFAEIQIMGGEPFLSKNFLRFIDSYNFKPHIVYKITTNLCPDTLQIWNRFFDKTRDCQVKISVSLDTGLDTAQQIRLGFNPIMFDRNLKELYQLDQVKEIEFINTVSCLTIFDRTAFNLYVQKQRDLTDKLITINHNYLEFPTHLNTNILDKTACDLLEIDLIEVPNKKLHQIRLIKFLLDMEKHSGVPLSYYNNLTSGFIQRIVTEYGIDTDRL